MKIDLFLEKNTKLILIAILCLATGLRFYKIDEHGLAGDEKYSLFVSQFVTYEGNNQHDSVRKPDSKYFTPKEFWSEKHLSDFFDSIARIDTGNGALYTYSLHYWTEIFGVSDKSLRIPSLIFNILTIILIFFFAKEHFHSANLGLFVSFLSAISPFYISYSQVARNYSINIFFSLLATHLFLQLINKEEEGKKPIIKYIIYGFCVLACELCHLATFPLFLIHALYFTLFFRRRRGYIAFILAASIPLIGSILWLKSDGGKWLIDYVTNSVKVYNQMALETPNDYLSTATLKHILKQIRHVVSAMFLPVDGYPTLSVLHKKKYLVILFTSILSLIVFIHTTWKTSDKQQFRLRVFLLLLSFLPIFTLVGFAYQDGNTFRIMPRYVAYSYSFSLILVAISIRDLLGKTLLIKYIASAVFAVQLLLILKLVNSVWEDKAPRYFSHFVEPRKQNPYQLSANKILQVYAKGDTVVYPSVFIEKRGGIAMPNFSVVDAQLTNFYLPKNSEIIQRVNIEEPDKIILKKADGTEKIMFDFQGAKYRY